MIEWKTSAELVPYEDALAFMDERVAAIHAGAAPECIWLLEHPPLYTAGTSAKDADLLNPQFPVFNSGRGGQYTYHGPGQRVVYVMLDLKKRQKLPDIKQYVCDLERWIIGALEAFGVKGQCIEGRIGVWVKKPSPLTSPLPQMGGGTWGEGEYKKIAAIGVRVRHWITLHGISINVNPDLSHFNGIVPCGISDAGVTSLADFGIKANMNDLDQTLKKTWDALYPAI
jgi:lipoyl(octanoyl) transferase